MTALHTIAFLNPGHFHAALTLKTANARVDPNIHLYASPGPERDSFVALIDAFNSRDDSPTAWTLHERQCADPLTELVNDGLADIVILAGHNASKLASIAVLHDAGIAVLADKPWLTAPSALADLNKVTSGLPLAQDIMTERHDVLARLRRRITADRQMFGEFVIDDLAGAAIEIGSKHHLFKRVNGAPLIRPSWYYDVNVQGDGLVDIQSHMTDQMQWLVGEEKDYALDVDVTDLKANRWGTPVPMDLFSDSTGLNEFPNSVEARVTDGVLDLQCNSEVSYTLRGVSVKQAAQWDQREPAGSGDIHAAHFRGTRAELILDHGAQTGFVPRLHVRPREGATEADLRAGVAQIQGEFPGLGLEASPIGYELTLPDSLRTTHEQHFAMVLNDFLDTLESGEWPATTAARIRMRYALLAKAKRLVDGETA